MQVFFFQSCFLIQFSVLLSIGSEKVQKLPLFLVDVNGSLFKVLKMYSFNCWKRIYCLNPIICFLRNQHLQKLMQKPTSVCYVFSFLSEIICTVVTHDFFSFTLNQACISFILSVDKCVLSVYLINNVCISI